MSQSFASTVFQANGRKHVLAVALQSYDPLTKDNELSVPLANSQILRFEYVNRLNGLVLEGKLVYVDTTGQVARIFGEQTILCQATYQAIKSEKEGGVDIEEWHKDQLFSHTFLVDSVNILSRERSKVIYEIYLVSNSWFKFASYVAYTNYKKGAEAVSDIIKNIFVEHGIAVEDKTFDELKIVPAIPYVSGESETVFSAFNYLMKRSFYADKSKVSALRFMVYDEQADKQRLFSLDNGNHYTGSFPVIINPKDADLELRFNSREVGLGAVVKRGSTDLHRSMSSRTIFGYTNAEGEAGEITPGRIETKEIVNCLNQKTDDNQMPVRFPGLSLGDKTIFMQTGTEWANSYDIYDEMVRDFMDVDGLIVEIDGDVRHKPASIFTVDIRERQDVVSTDQNSESEDIKNRYKQFRGPWIATSVRHVIVPIDESDGGMFRSNVCLSRNVLNDDN